MMLASLAGGWSTLPSAPRPPAAAAAVAAEQQQQAAPSTPALADTVGAKPSSSAAAPHTDLDDDDGMCVVCLDRPCDAGFLHGERCAVPASLPLCMSSRVCPLRAEDIQVCAHCLVCVGQCPQVRLPRVRTSHQADSQAHVPHVQASSSPSHLIFCVCCTCFPLMYDTSLHEGPCSCAAPHQLSARFLGCRLPIDHVILNFY
jgi:hypothetical protein